VRSSKTSKPLDSRLVPKRAAPLLASPLSQPHPAQGGGTKTHLFLVASLALAFAACTQAPAAVPEEAPAAAVRLETVRRTTFQPELTVLGVVRPGGLAEVSVPAGGRVRYPARFAAGLVSGLAVSAGELLARVSLQDAEAGLAEARLRLDAAASELARHQRAFDQGVEAAATLASFKAEADLARSRLVSARQRLGRLDLRAPVSGRLIVDQKVPAESEVAAGTVLARIAAGGSLRIEGRAAAADRDRLHAGLAVRFGVPGAAPGVVRGLGVIREVAPVVDAGGTVALLAEVTDPAGLPAPGEGVELHVALDRHEQALTLPEDALVLTEGGNAVFVAERSRGALIAHRKVVETGARGGGRVEVLRGLAPGDKVVVSGAADLADGDTVAAVEEIEAKDKQDGKDNKPAPASGSAQ